MGSHVNRMHYLATAQLLVDTHNALVKVLHTKGGPGEPHLTKMQRFTTAFNRICTEHVIRTNGNNQYILLLKADDV